jgi:hypothetical protein
VIPERTDRVSRKRDAVIFLWRDGAVDGERPNMSTDLLGFDDALYQTSHCGTST